ncbi:MAG: hypothetical protein V4702_01970 [Patescibacteria group bacterium]
MPIPEMIQTVPAIVAAGYTVGVCVELAVQRALHNEDRTFSEEMHGATISIPKPSLGRRLGSAALGPVAAWSGVVAGVSVAAWMPSETIQTASPNLQIVADLSGATALGDQAPLRRVRSITEAFAGKDDLDVQIIMARGGLTETVSPDELKKMGAFGDSPIEASTSTAIDNSSELRKKAITANAAARTVGVLVLSNDNSANQSSIVSKAKTEGVPVWTVNVGNSNESTDDLQAIAKGTNAKYWDVTAKPNKIRDEVTSTLKSRSEPVDKPKPNRFLQAASVFSIMYLPVMFGWRRRRMQPLNNGLIEEGRI